MAGALAFVMFAASPAAARSAREAAALYACKSAIRAMAQHRVAKPPGNVANVGEGDRFIFAWGEGSIVLENGFGGAVPVSAACGGSLAACRIEGLVINGEPVLKSARIFACD